MSTPEPGDLIESLLVRYLDQAGDTRADFEAWLAAQPELAGDESLRTAVRQAHENWLHGEQALAGGLPAKESGSHFFRRGWAHRENASESEALLPGRVLGDFELVRLIGKGGMGQVWEAEQLSLGGRRVALKLVLPEHYDERGLELFAREARAGGRLSHPGIVTVHGHGTSEGLAWIALELVSGSWTLKDFLDVVRSAPEVPADHDRRVARLVAEIADAMQAAHDARVIHRDLKPGNVLVTPQDHPKVTDFGLAKLLDESALKHTVAGGTFLYMSPEQITAENARIDHRSDLFSLGIVLYELLALRRPFEGDTAELVAFQILKKDPPDPRTIRSKIPRDLAVITLKALEKEPGRRYQTMRELAEELRRFLQNEPIRARPPRTFERLVKWARRNPVKSTTAGFASLALSAIVTFMAYVLDVNSQLSSASEIERILRAEAEEREREARVYSLSFEIEALNAADDDTTFAATQGSPSWRWWTNWAQVLVNGRSANSDDRSPALPGLTDVQAYLAQLALRATPQSPAKVAELRTGHPRHDELLRLETETDLMSMWLNPSQSAILSSLEKFKILDSDALARLRESGLVDGDGKDALNAIRTEVARSIETLACPGTVDYHLKTGIALALFSDFGLAASELQKAVSLAPPDQAEDYENNVRNFLSFCALISSGRMAQMADARTAYILELQQEIERDTLRFANSLDSWRFDELAKIESGLLSIQERLQIAEQSVLNGRAFTAWQEAIQAISTSPHYSGLQLAPQVGLIPIGMDQNSGLWEFAHLGSGQLAQRKDGAGIQREEGMGLVFVLLPGGHVPRDSSEDQIQDLALCEVELAPFFLSKYEMTEAQWRHVTGSWTPQDEDGLDNEGQLLPKGDITWNECRDVLRTVGWLSIPTEAQWEYACRARTSTPWWTGDEESSLQGAENILSKEGFVVREIGSMLANPFGLHDMHGNVAEWCLDEPYGPPARSGNGARAPGSSDWRVVRGHYGLSVRSSASTSRNSHRQETVLGLRPVRAVFP